MSRSACVAPGNLAGTRVKSEELKKYPNKKVKHVQSVYMYHAWDNGIDEKMETMELTTPVARVGLVGKTIGERIKPPRVVRFLAWKTKQTKHTT